MPLATATIAAVPAHEPAVASSVVTGMKRLLIEDGRWGEVRAHILARDPDAVEWLDAPAHARWFPALRHAAILTALQELVGDDGLRAIGRRRMQESTAGGPLAPIFRGWARSYAAAPSQLLRVGPHAWNAATRGLGSLVVASTGDRELRMRWVATPEIMRSSGPWMRYLEGFGAGLLELGGLEGEVAMTLAPEGMSLLFRWR